MRKGTGKRLAAVVLTLGLMVGLMAAAKSPAIPEKAEVKTGVTVYSNTKAAVDASNLAEGYLLVRYTGGKDVKIKVQITKTGGTTYTYNLGNTGVDETFPLTEGDGTYTVKVYENTTGTRYAQAYSVTLTLKLRSEFLPFLYPNQFVNYTAESAVAKKAAELTEKDTTALSRLQHIYDFVVGSFSYDYELAKTVQSGYLPDVDKILEARKGICFDYAAVMSAMLRAQNIPCKLVVGYAGTTYHAWIDVYIDGIGWVDKVIYFDGTAWTLMDPTFVSSGNHSDRIMKYVTTGSNYAAKYAY